MTTVLDRAPEQTAAVAAPPAPALPSPAAPAAPAVPAAAAAPAARLVLSGTLTGADADRLEPRLDALAATTADTVEVDLSRVGRIDTRVARLLLRTSWRLGDPGRSLLLLRPNRRVHRVLRFVGAGHLAVR